MKNNIKAYLDSFNLITIIMNQNLYNGNHHFYLKDNDLEKIDLEIIEVIDLGDFKKIIVKSLDNIILTKNYYLFDNYGNSSILYSGKIVRENEFDMVFYTDAKLGVSYSKESTSFSFWSPVVKEAEVEILYPNGTKKFFDFEVDESGVWRALVLGNLKNHKYRFIVLVQGEYKRIIDPYARLVDSDLEYGIIVDFKDTYQFKYAKPKMINNPCDMVIYEASVRDLTHNLKQNPDSFLGLVSDEKINDIPVGLNYIHDLGITHLQLLPVMDFGGVDCKNKSNSYNWGYNPVNYNSLSQFYSSNINNPLQVIDDFKKMVDEAHNKNIRVVLDVVYNHAYIMAKSIFEALVPGYYFRYDNEGMKTDISGCGNDIASERLMVNRFIVDSITFIAKTYNIDGFRFDLMGLLDIKTINDCRKALKEIDPNIVIYGEGWNMNSNIHPNLKANYQNQRLIPEVSYFNDVYRNAIKGNHFESSNGFIFQKMDYNYISKLILGSSDNNFLFASPSQSINYIECHDDYTLYDYVKLINSNLSEYELEQALALANSLVIISLGIPFIHSGQEFFDTKNGVRNSYNAGDEINKFDFDLCKKNSLYVNMVKDLISIRKEYKEFRFNSQNQIKNNVYVEPNNRYLEINYCNPTYTLRVIIKTDLDLYDISLDCDEVLIFDSRKKTNIKDYFKLENKGIYIIRKENN